MIKIKSGFMLPGRILGCDVPVGGSWWVTQHLLLSLAAFNRYSSALVRIEPSCSQLSHSSICIVPSTSTTLLFDHEVLHFDCCTRTDLAL